MPSGHCLEWFPLDREPAPVRRPGAIGAFAWSGSRLTGNPRYGQGDRVPLRGAIAWSELPVGREPAAAGAPGCHRELVECVSRWVGSPCLHISAYAGLWARAGGGSASKGFWCTW